ncbi:B12-binding domain-containing radical SAM protein [Thermoflexus sp.]|uniref:B12-binding domain-containing radical SAM protein n=2 Tax=Thermoflexus sp. TaxID=1969742 RepID=UPI002638A011|nr:B12-binding domain-containing radical SAM protein [Thermoflexus sp.]MCX7691712.1 radical SAM protein [Thermoflexus sp.]MDW8065903.1 B12-binding domain-containing radical SAM protein [Anaerolineae bacterium]
MEENVATQTPIEVMSPEELRRNLGTRRIPPLPRPKFPDASAVVQRLRPPRSPEAVDVLLVNPPSPDGAVWIRSQHRVGRRSRENMIWPQVSLAQMAAMLHPDYSVEIVDAIALRMDWKEFETLLRRKQPKYYITQVTAPTLTNDMYGAFLARSLGAKTIAFGTHVTPMPIPTMEAYPALDFVLRGEPELTLRELIDTLEGRVPEGRIRRLFEDSDPEWFPLNEGEARDWPLEEKFGRIKGLVWRHNGQVRVNIDRPFIRNLDDMPLPLHHLLPLYHYRAPLIRGPYTFIVTSRGCTAGCTYCIKHVSYQYSIRLRSPESIVEEVRHLVDLGIRNIHMYADLFTISRDQVVGMCDLLIQEGLRIRWTCNSRVDYVDREMLRKMAQAGCWLISWGIESANEQILKGVRKGYRLEQAPQALRWAKEAGIKNWGYFIIGLPGETDETIRQTIEFAKSLPLDLALFHIAAPYPGTPFFFQVVENNWFRPGTAWEEVDMDRSTVLDYPGLPAERLEYWQKRAFREWALRPGPILTFLKGAMDPAVLGSAAEVAIRHVRWLLGKE